MKKRKPPIVLASVLVVLVSVAVIMSLPKAHKEEDPGKLTAEEAIPSGAPRPTPTKEELKGRLADSGPQNEEGEMVRPLGKNPLKNNPKASTIFLPKPGNFKPTPNDTSISGQWYREDSRLANK